jgi:putative membrane protein
MMGLGLGMGGIGFIFMILFWIGLIVVAIWLVGIMFPSAKAQEKHKSGSSPSAREILKERYAKGDLTTEQYHEMLKTIEQ